MGKGGSNNAPQFDPQRSQVSAYLPTGTLRYGTVGPGGQFSPGTGGTAYQVYETPGAAQFRQAYEKTGQNIMDRAMEMSGNLPTGPVDYAGLPEFQGSIDYSGVSPVVRPEDFGAEGARLEQATFDRAMGLLNPQFERQNESFEADLAARGLAPGSTAYRTGRGDLREAQNEAMTRAALDAVGAGRQYQSQLFGQGLQSRGAQVDDLMRNLQLNNLARSTGFGERSAVRANMLNELAQMLQGPQIQAAVPINDQSFAGEQQAYQGQMNAYNQQQALRQQALGGLYGLGGSLLGGWASTWG